MPGGYEWIIIVAVLLLLFGAKKLPDMARSVGQSARVFKGEMKGLKDDETTPDSGKPAEDAKSAPQVLPASTTTNGSTGTAGAGEAQPQTQAQPGRSTDAT